jgi:hypothetical protein
MAVVAWSPVMATEPSPTSIPDRRMRNPKLVTRGLEREQFTGQVKLLEYVIEDETTAIVIAMRMAKAKSMRPSGPESLPFATSEWAGVAPGPRCATTPSLSDTSPVDHS